MILLGVLAFFYAGLILFLVFGFNKVPVSKVLSTAGKTGFSIVIPFRNETENLPALLKSLAALQYPADQFEIIFVDDASEDDSVEICRSFMEQYPYLQISLISSERNTSSPKKDAVNTAIRFSAKDYILTTDADCSVPSYWMNSLDTLICDTGAAFIAGPVSMVSPKAGKRSLLEIFQEIDFMSLQGATIGGFGVDKPFMCNGANLCYEKAAFNAVNGFEGNEGIASGDDVFLLEKFEQCGHRTAFLKSRDAVVTTGPQPSLSSLLTQRIRWAAKTPNYQGGFGKAVAMMIFLMNLTLVIALPAVFMGELSQQHFFLVFLVKFNVDFYLIYKCAVFFKREQVMKNYFWCSFVYPFFSTYVAVASLFCGYTWKGRRFKK